MRFCASFEDEHIIATACHADVSFSRRVHFQLSRSPPPQKKKCLRSDGHIERTLIIALFYLYLRKISAIIYVALAMCITRSLSKE